MDELQTLSPKESSREAPHESMASLADTPIVDRQSTDCRRFAAAEWRGAPTVLRTPAVGCPGLRDERKRRAGGRACQVDLR